MKSSLLSLTLLGSFWLGSATTLGQASDYPIQPVPFTDVHVDDPFWSPRIEKNRTETIPASFARIESTGRLKNFDMAAKGEGKFCTTYTFDDTDIYKTIEGASFSMAVHPDPQLDAYVDSLIGVVKAAQEPDGYLYTARTIDPANPHKWAGPERWVLEHENSHELYNSGHLFEAAAAHYQATGKRNLLDIALKNADLLLDVFGPNKRHVAPGHEVVEMGLVKLYRLTGREKYLDLAKFFIDERGKREYDENSPDPWKNGKYWQDATPVVDEDEAVGHAVRAMYLYAAVADVAALTGDEAYTTAVDRIWDNMVGKKIYVQGGIGAVPSGERFGENYDLPNHSAYNETCAAIGNVYWNHRMFLLHGDAKYMDVLEKVLYNGMISGVGMDGKTFFYTNAMQITDHYQHHDLERERSGWFVCSCCPTNVTRFMPSIPGYVYAKRNDDLYVNLFINGSADVDVKGKSVTITQENNYPWDGGLAFTLKPRSSTEFNLKIRIPGWVQNEALPSDLYRFEGNSDAKPEINVNGQAVDYTMDKGYAVLSRKWKRNDKVEVMLPMDVRRVVANEQVEADRGKVAIQRGPLIYCAEWKDNDGQASNILLPEQVEFTPTFESSLLNGVTVLEGQAPKVEVIDNGLGLKTETKPVRLIPYYAWANRGPGEMQIWFPEKVTGVELFAEESK
ncbi:hypothetical protein SAMN05421823_106155 [Catalinimonas alkaloidigena]|uniref:DUF1680 family protein n=1 Tax=Catalinimonas alkaloidigena TaxID=1075417 RepID=A0A1G9KHG6_9BACT|nr:glycoside hydrolase family 127 protein [Catalinimonas alkaloidigena]SDL48865.1 hypothetical protein SAMN05421823_106155 [Catalinimonas alkaloidigena]